METGEIKNEKVFASPRLRPKTSLKHDWMKELRSEVAGSSEDSQQTQPKINNPIGRTERPVSGQSIGLFTQREEIDIDFRLFGLRHAVVKQAENFCVRELVKKIESHLHREALEADLSQKNAYNPFSDDSKAMIRQMGNVELFELCETIPNMRCSECLLFWNRGVIYCTCGHLLVKKRIQSNIFVNGNWMLSQSRTSSSERGDLVVLGTAKLRHKKSTMWPTMRGRDVSKENLEFTIVSNEIQYIVIFATQNLVGEIGT